MVEFRHVHKPERYHLLTCFNGNKKTRAITRTADCPHKKLIDLCCGTFFFWIEYICFPKLSKFRPLADPMVTGWVSLNGNNQTLFSNLDPKIERPNTDDFHIYSIVIPRAANQSEQWQILYRCVNCGRYAVTGHLKV